VEQKGLTVPEGFPFQPVHAIKVMAVNQCLTNQAGSLPDTNHNKMKKLIKMLPFLGLVLAAVFAFAFSNPVPQGLIQFGNDNGTYVPLTDLEEGEDYICDEDDRPCVVTFSNNNPQTGVMTVVKAGIWTEQP
jgi:hypothetical protein